MRVGDLERLYDYGYWANAKLFSVISRLAPGQFAAPVAGSYESIRNTLVHVLSAEWGWLERCGGAPRGEKLKADDYPTLESLVQAWALVEEHVRRFLAGLQDAGLERTIEFSFGSGPRYSARLGDLMQHGAMHAVHHLGQVAMLLRMLGQAPGNFDMLFYFAHER